EVVDGRPGAAPDDGQADGPHGEFPDHDISPFRSSYSLTSSTRRFDALPASVSLPAAGRSGPKPRGSSRSAATPAPVRAATTDRARASDRVRLCAAGPVLSVWPSTPRRRPG